MSLIKTRQSLTRLLARTPSKDALDQMKAEQKALHPFLEPLDVVMFLNKGMPGSDAERSAVVAALIAAAQTMNDDTAFNILLLAFMPMLGKFGRQLYHWLPTADEQAAHVLEAFCQGIAEFDLEAQSERTVAELRRQTKNNVCRALTRHQSLQKNEHLFFDGDNTRIFDAQILSDKMMIQRGEVMDLIRIFEWAASNVSVDRAALLVTTYTGATSLKGWVQSQNPHLPEPAVRREYERIRRQRSRTMAGIRKLSGKHCGMRPAPRPIHNSKIAAVSECDWSTHMSLDVDGTDAAFSYAKSILKNLCADDLPPQLVEQVAEVVSGIVARHQATKNNDIELGESVSCQPHPAS